MILIKALFVNFVAFTGIGKLGAKNNSHAKAPLLKIGESAVMLWEVYKWRTMIY
jgi:hypothetical protein